jgi:hypothetical protein
VGRLRGFCEYSAGILGWGGGSKSPPAAWMLASHMFVQSIGAAMGVKVSIRSVTCIRELLRQLVAGPALDLATRQAERRSVRDRSRFSNPACYGILMLKSTPQTAGRASQMRLTGQLLINCFKAVLQAIDIRYTE